MLDHQLLPNYELTRPTKRAGVVYRPPVEKKKLESLRRARDEEEQKLAELKLMEVRE